jgi:hypothetical protein
MISEPIIDLKVVSNTFTDSRGGVVAVAER